jgi:uncharacterized protein YjiS (DUF1127 family)
VAALMPGHQNGAPAMPQSSVMEAPRASATARTGRNVLSVWACSIQTWLIRRQGWQDLNSLNDHLLKDVGISREDALWKPNGWLGIRPFRVHEYF